MFKFILIICFDPCVVTLNNQLYLQEQLQLKLHSLVRELGPSSWMAYDALALKIALWTVTTMELVFITVPTLNMLVLCVQVSNTVSCVSTVFQVRTVNFQVA